MAQQFNCCGIVSIPGPGTPTCLGCKKKKGGHSRLGAALRMRSRKISSVLLECLNVSDSPGDLVKNANCCFVFVFLGPHPQHMEVPRPWVQSELQLLAYTTATATWDLSGACDLRDS